MGSEKTLTIQGKRAVQRADLIIGARRMADSIREPGQQVVYEYRSDVIGAYIKSHPEYENIVIALSGDVGFYSGAKKLLDVLNGRKPEGVLADGFKGQEDSEKRMAVSPLRLSAEFLLWFILCPRSVYPGMMRRSPAPTVKNCNLVSMIKQNQKVFSILGTGSAVAELAQKLVEYEMGDVVLYVGENLSYPDEKIFQANASELTSYEGQALSVVCAYNEKARPAFSTHGIPDEKFIRGKAPMTKEEVRCVSLSKLRLQEDSICYDVGAGTGSVSVEMALRADQGQVFAVEKKDDAVALLYENKQRFATDNLEIIKGEAPEALKELPVPTHAFIGGSSGNLKEIVALLLEKNRDVRIVINCITLETISEALEILKEYDFADQKQCSLQPPDQKIGRYHLMMERILFILSLARAPGRGYDRCGFFKSAEKGCWRGKKRRTIMKKRIPRILLAAGASGSGKTLLTCGLLQVLVNRGIKTVSFKCGPDYIDPMFHTQVIGTKSRNLDTFFTGEDITRSLLAKNSADCEIAVMEGVMGFYDGVAGTTTLASAYDLARVTDTPVILIVNSKGMSVSLAAYIKGFLEYKKDSRIKGVIFNQMSPMLYPRMKKLVEEELGIKVLGYVPRVEDCVIESRHLGLILPEEIPELKGRLLKLAEVLEHSLEIEEILKLANEAPVLEYPLLEKTDERSLCQPAGTSAIAEKVKREVDALTEMSQVYTWKSTKKLRIGLAKDEAFCFFYEDNLDLLRSMGAELVAFSPVHDGHLPENLDGLLLYGGYPELNGKALEENLSMRQEIAAAIKDGMPCLAECGGFMYLHESMEGMDGKFYEMAGVIPGKVWRTPRLTRFGYITLKQNQGISHGKQETAILGESDLGVSPAHEFHYFDSDNCGTAFHASKPESKRGWDCMHGSDHLLAGFPHLYYYANPKIPQAFLKKCLEYKELQK